MRRAPSQPPELPGYRHVGILGSGGFADVFLYEQRLPRRQVAVKVLLADDLSRDTRSQFVAEANLMAQLSAHPYIVTIFHADVAGDGRPYFVMEYCPGPSLAAQLKQAPFGVENALRTGIRLAGAVATAHAAGILHRDIKPANVLTNAYGWPALSDFGISSNLEGELPVHTMTFTRGAGDAATSTGQSAVGLSVPWSPPELFEDEARADVRSDVYSLAATVHTLLAGRSPFEIAGRPNGSLDLMGRIERGAITPFTRTDLPRSLVEVLRKGMAVRPDDRYASAVDFARALQRVELELGYATTSIEVPRLVEEQAAPGDAGGAIAPPEPGDAQATRARSVQSVVAQQPQEEATRHRAPQQVVAQQPAVDDRTVIRPPGTTHEAHHGVTDETVIRTKPDPAQAAAATTARRRTRVGVVVAGVAAGIVAVVVAVAVALSLSSPSPDDPGPEASESEDAVVEEAIPMPTVAPGVVAPDGTSATFAVSHDAAEEGDVYRWKRVDGIGDTQLSKGPDVVVTGLAPGQSVCVDVTVQRGTKTSEPVRGCTA
ncbi:protein kinase [Agromyces sp. CFH 90414]|uniref:non-specific serine/threonine protein kinase n=1 Tax=Agromyces agglutinans TaxID=2662258 RepID=A0A6I2F9Q9_9MICO|nr:serine/threonine-protein kinase [Agromyces agglutinans]MRG58743.1 protein kinase [Agromyces agglutinans]